MSKKIKWADSNELLKAGTLGRIDYYSINEYYDQLENEEATKTDKEMLEKAIKDLKAPKTETKPAKKTKIGQVEYYAEGPNKGKEVGKVQEEKARESKFGKGVEEKMEKKEVKKGNIFAMSETAPEKTFVERNKVGLEMQVSSYAADEALVKEEMAAFPSQGDESPEGFDSAHPEYDMKAREEKKKVEKKDLTEVKKAAQELISKGWSQEQVLEYIKEIKKSSEAPKEEMKKSIDELIAGNEDKDPSSFGIGSVSNNHYLDAPAEGSIDWEVAQALGLSEDQVKQILGGK